MPTKLNSFAELTSFGSPISSILRVPETEDDPLPARILCTSDGGLTDDLSDLAIDAERSSYPTTLLVDDVTGDVEPINKLDLALVLLFPLLSPSIP